MLAMWITWVLMLTSMQTWMFRLWNNRNLIWQYKDHFQQTSVRWCHDSMNSSGDPAPKSCQMSDASDSHGGWLAPQRKAWRLRLCWQCTRTMQYHWRGSEIKMQTFLLGKIFHPLWRLFFQFNGWIYDPSALWYRVHLASKYPILVIDSKQKEGCTCSRIKTNVLWCLPAYWLLW